MESIIKNITKLEAESIDTAKFKQIITNSATIEAICDIMEKNGSYCL